MQLIIDINYIDNNIEEISNNIFIHKKKYNLLFKDINNENKFNILLNLFNKGLELLFKKKKELLEENITLLKNIFKNINIKFICKKYNSIYNSIYYDIIDKNKNKNFLHNYYEKRIIGKYTYIIFFDEIN
tara:strand:- start:1588 stop:1977 length:390 start_codon:yes stop_codon:yes gene_type:complete